MRRDDDHAAVGDHCLRKGRRHLERSIFRRCTGVDRFEPHVESLILKDIFFSSMSFPFCAKAFRTNGPLILLIITISCVCTAACSDRPSLPLQTAASNAVSAENAVNIN